MIFPAIGFTGFTPSCFAVFSGDPVVGFTTNIVTTQLTFKKIRACRVLPPALAAIGRLWLYGLLLTAAAAGLALLIGQWLAQWVLFVFFLTSGLTFFLVGAVVILTSLWTGETLTKELKYSKWAWGRTINYYEVKPCYRKEQFAMFWIEIVVLVFHVYILSALNFGLAYASMPEWLRVHV